MRKGIVVTDIYWELVKRRITVIGRRLINELTFYEVNVHCV
jgi:hypothetical protein